MHLQLESAYLTKEIETLSTNIMTFRSRIAFSVFIGPFLILSSIIIATTKNGFSIGMHTTGAWIAAVLAAAAFWGLGLISGHVEFHAWNKCNEWRKCIIKLQGEEAISGEELEALILDKRIIRKLTWAYALVYLIMLVMFGSTAYLVTELLQR